ncbi:MAG: phytanoyl-CoA dioxygenase family protein [Chitinophagaceae bacterium]|nr:phytanoyl-CoA dioxygenase family protein [Chitinophagaceae bacterium]
MYRKIKSPIYRNYELQLFKDKKTQEEFNEKGYVHLKDIIPFETIHKLRSTYQEIKNEENFECTNFYINSIAFKSTHLKEKIRNEVGKIIEPFISNFLLNDNIRYPISVGFCINPAKSILGSRLHQDPNLVDETKSYSIVLWIPLDNTDELNGCLRVVKNSHLWGNHLRSNYHLKWHFDKFVDDILNENSTAIPAKPCDIICFDPALIHGSGRNITDTERIAIQISLISKKDTLITVVEENKLFPKAIYYQIDEDYFTNETVKQHPTEKYPIIKYEKLNYYYTRKSILQLINAYKK